LPGNGFGEQSLTRSWRSHEQHAFRRTTAEPCVFIRVLQKIDDLNQFVFCLVNARDVGKGDLLVRILVVSPGLAFTHSEHGAAHTARLAPGAAKQPYIKTDDQQGRAEPEQDGGPRTGCPDGHCPNLNLMFNKKRLKPGVNKVGKQGREMGDSSGLAPSGLRSGLSRVWRGRRYGRYKLPFNRLPLAVYGPDVAFRYLLLEHGVRNGRGRVSIREKHPHDQIIGDQDKKKNQPGLAWWDGGPAAGAGTPRIGIGRRMLPASASVLVFLHARSPV